MADKDDANGCGCMILIAIVVFIGYKIQNVIEKNKDTIDSGWEVAKSIGPWVLVGIIGIVVFSRIFKYLGRIKKWERVEFANYMEINDVEKWLTTGESNEVGKTIDALESSLEHAKRKLSNIKSKYQNLRKA